MALVRSLNDRLSKQISVAVLMLVSLFVVGVLVAVSFSSKRMFQKQAETWISAFPEYILPHLIDSDHFSISGKLELLKSSGLFASVKIRDAQKEMIASFENDRAGDKEEEKLISIQDKAGVVWGFYSYRTDFYAYFKPFLWIGLSIIFLIGIIYLFVRWRLSKNLNREFDKFTSFLFEIEKIASNITDSNSATNELNLPKHLHTEEQEKVSRVVENLIKQINRSHEQLKELITAQEQQKTQIEMGHIATQVAHDIRSPLSSVQAAAEYLGQMRIEDPKAGEVLNLLELSAKRLTGIADDLLKKHKGGVEEKSDFSIHQVLDELVGEFQGQEKYRSIQFVKRYSSKAIHIQGNAGKLQRAFGNIIKNGVEAMGFNGTVTLGTQENGEKMTVSISDTGPGMLPEKLEKVLGGGFTDGKADGHGIGMKVVKETAEEHGGRIWGESILEKGTTFFIELPITTHKSSSETFTLILASKGPVLVVDDDPGLREQWRLTLRDQGIKTLLCDSMEDLLRQKISSSLTKTAVIDYHFDNSEKTGADVVQHLKGNGFINVYLCTAEYWKPSIQKLVKDLGVEICPKPLPKISVQVSECRSVEVEESKTNGGYTVLVIDDDLGIRMSWEMMQKRLGIAKLHAYANLEALQQATISLQNIDIAFVDKNIEGSQFSGAEVIRHLKTNGVSRVALASGESEETLRQNPQFSNVDFIIGKSIPTDFKAFFS